MLELLTTNFKNILHVIIGIIFAAFLTWSILNYTEKVRLRNENKLLIQTKIVQENVIKIHDVNRKKDKNLQKETEKQIEQVRKIKSKNQKDFIKKSDCIFKNFGQKYHECN